MVRRVLCSYHGTTSASKTFAFAICAVRRAGLIAEKAGLIADSLQSPKQRTRLIDQPREADENHAWTGRDQCLEFA